MPTPAPVNISDAESHVMEILWRAPGPIVAEQVVVALHESQHWQSATVKTLLNRLLKKGAIAAEKDGRRFLYCAVLPREAWLARESESLVQRLFGGRIAPLVAHFGSQRKLSQADIQELRKVIDELDDGK
ncbi:BlaI/MecI/CopY family transcriptional regulator [Massilia yuzhufengensis]|uniref:Predicted transcriptional regulator n=1 Tax=Massilia yuzhufengensis TaxID=1164594 RepID=A0A1I1RD58_9BURK|nr:BlaI/MecI/CopY family transcriptional regulator [Massilia yuzhufengensis]SFD32326.1 Predicted transcriptional regulator [Massilia yuzhufengensis]